MASMASQVEQVKRAQTLALAHRLQGMTYTTYRYRSIRHSGSGLCAHLHLVVLVHL